MLSMIGYAVGLGNIWRFPYLCYKNGGGAFLIPYFICLLICGLPIFFLEVALGQFSSKGPTKAFNGVPIIKGIGYTMMVVSFLIGCYYNVIIAYTLRYLVDSLSALGSNNLPWVGCTNAWNDNNCMNIDRRAYCNDVTAHSNGTVINIIDSNFTCPANDTITFGASQQYWENHVLNMSDGIDNIG